MKKHLIGICGSATQNSSNELVLTAIGNLIAPFATLEIRSDLDTLPHFQTELTSHNTPKEILDLRERIAQADGVIISTPEYVFSIPSRLKNALEWCVSTTVFTDKPLAMVTASANGTKGHEELQLIMKTLRADFSDATYLLIQGIKGKIDANREINDPTMDAIKQLTDSFIQLISDETIA